MLSFALSPHGDRLYTLAGDRSEPRIWEIEGDGVREVRWAVSHHDIAKIAPSADGRYVVLGHMSGEVSIVNAGDGSFLSSIPSPGASDGVTALAFSSYGELAVGFRSGVIRVWSIGQGGRAKPVVTLPHPQGEVRGLVYAPHGHRLAAGDESGADIWDLDQVRSQLGAIGLGW